MTKIEIKGNLNIIRGKLHQRWAKLTDNNPMYLDGQQTELVGRIQKHTGQTWEDVEKAMNALEGELDKKH